MKMIFQRVGQMTSFVVLGGVCGMYYEKTKQRKTQNETSSNLLPNLTTVDLMEAVGNTPLIELKSLSKLTGTRIYGKAEHLNPSGSVKDRAAKYLILQAEKDGLVHPGDTIIEGTGGNTGIGLALLAASRGYKTIFTMPEFIASEKVELMKTLGAQVHLQPPVPLSDPRHYYTLAGSLAKTMKNSYFPNQVCSLFICKMFKKYMSF